jgi:hypothetical protein
MNEIVPGGELLLGFSGGRLPARVEREAMKDLAQVAGRVPGAAARLNAGAFLASMGQSHVGMLAAQAEAIVAQNPAAAYGVAAILESYGNGAAALVGRMLQ